MSTEESTPDVIASTTKDMLISEEEPPDDIVYYLNTKVTNGHRRKAYYLKQLSMRDNNDCCKILSLNEIIVADPNATKHHGVRATTYINLIYDIKHPKRSKGCQENAIVDNVKSTLVTALLAVAHYLKQFFNQVIQTYAYNNQFKNLPGDKRLKDRVQSDWVSKTCRNIQVQVIKTAAFNNHLALKDLIRRSSYHLLREDDLSTSFNIFFHEDLLTLFSEIVKFTAIVFF